ncbi:MAG TPA: hypothetical protein VL096_15285, partial [Pirellulaceae bacterium]|nr:hypothetical protein [Pirellulaceae bacterium]
HHWLSVSAAQQPATSVTLRCVALAGSFTGFGGLFARPPLVFVQAGRFITTDQQSTWEMLGDAYGVWFCRVGGAASSPPTRTNQADVTIDRQGIIRWGKLSLSAPQLAATTSIACDGQTLAVTIPTSHHVFLYSRTERPV